jgi:hypothetical protein
MRFARAGEGEHQRWSTTMYGSSPSCVFLVFSNAGPGGPEALAKWYREMHGPDAFKGDMFFALHRYQAGGSYAAQFLAVWEGTATSLDEVRSRMSLDSGAPRDRSRITSDLVVVWSEFHFRVSSSRPAVTPSPVRTLSLVEGASFDRPDGSCSYDYGDIVLYESDKGVETVRNEWVGKVSEGMAPRGPYLNIFDHPESWPPKALEPREPWISHWEPLSSLYANDRLEN